MRGYIFMIRLGERRSTSSLDLWGCRVVVIIWGYMGVMWSMEVVEFTKGVSLDHWGVS